jgi:hypothetical protein
MGGYSALYQKPNPNQLKISMSQNDLNHIKIPSGITSGFQ